MKKILIIILFLLPLHAYLQEWKLEYSLGYGIYKLDDIVDLQLSMDFNYGLRETECFPGYFTHTVLFGYSKGFHYFGSNFSYLTTGGRLHRGDYSGSYTIDMILNGYRLGAFYRYYIVTEELPDIFLQLSPGVLFSNLDINEQVIIYSESKNDNITMKGTGIYFEPSIGTTYRFKNWLQSSLVLGYEFDYLGTLKLSDQKTQIKANWNGVRIYAGLTFTLPTKKIVQ